jgi:Zn-finger nucleic acid-binding protein
MARPVIKFDQKYCSECGIRMPPVAFKRPYAKMCPDCKGDNRSDNQELKKLFKQLNAKASNEKEDWGSQNITPKDNVLFRKPKW